ncbi:MAG: helix-turn-helix domain-containing protein [Myxococcales bacterium]|nr:helix-turn-helix domain-containing protein [Myxococcales bacterium]
MRGYGQFCSVAQALEVLGERWTLLVVRELIEGSSRFNELLRGVPLMSRTLLSQRLKTLESCGVVERRKGEGGAPEYHLTEAGRDLQPIVSSIGIWGQRWAHRELTRDDLDPTLLMWDMQRRLDVDALPERRTVVQFWFRDMPASKNRFWLRLDKPDVELCLHNPGRDVDLKVETKCRTMVDVWMGHRELRAALRAREITLDGPRRLQRAFADWLLLSYFAPAGRAQAEAGRLSGRA